MKKSASNLLIYNSLHGFFSFVFKFKSTRVVIDEENPYIESEDNVFIRVVE